MFNLESSIANWRQQMLAAGIQTPVPLDELEMHLREEIHELTASGMEPQTAFTTAIKKIGQPAPLQAEFTKIDKKSRLTEPFVIKVLVYAIWFCLILPVYLFALYKKDMSWTWRFAGLANVIFGTLAIFYGHRLGVWFPAIPNRVRRKTIGIVSAVLSMAILVTFMNFILPRLSLTEGQLAVTVLWSLTIVSLGGFIEAGLETAAKRGTTTTA